MTSTRVPGHLRRQRAVSDKGPIVFPTPSSCPSDVFPPDFEQPSDLIVDPYGNFYCFVCQVSVPKGDSNVSQHLDGKKHETHNKHFASEEEKDQVRQKFLQAALQQRIARGVPLYTADAAASPANKSASVLAPTVRPVTASHLNTSQLDPDLQQPSNPSTSPQNISSFEQLDPTSSCSNDPGSEPKTRKAKRLAEAKRLSAVQIDKKAFLSELFEAEEQSASDSESPDLDENLSSELALSQRRKPFGPLDFKPPEGPDYFLESMAEETTPSGTAAKVREALAKKRKVLHKDQESSSVQIKGSEVGDVVEEFLSFVGTEKDKAERLEEQERAKARQKARESFIVLKDESGEELPPWLLNAEATEKVLYSSDSSISLHYEILEFCKFVSPTQAELNSRNELIMTVESIVKQLWPSSTIEIFGSYATGLYLPFSDIDICVTGTPEGGAMSEFEQLAEAIRNVTGFARRVKVIQATVNLVKIISRKTSMNCDICIGVPNGPKYIPVIKEYVQNYPALKPLLLVVKCFLRQRNLNEVYDGGLGSYTILLLVVSHLQMLKYNFQTTKSNLGALLQLFFHLYGRMHNMCLAGIQVKDNGCYFDKFERYQTSPGEVLRLSIEDPNDVTNELGRNGFGASRVRKAFANSSKSLVDWRRDNSSVPPTPLSTILQPDDLLRFRRTAVIEDLEEKGETPLRESLNPLKKQLSWPGTNARPSQRQSSYHVMSGGDLAGAEYMADSNSLKRISPPNQQRERDPRLAKRRRRSNDREYGVNSNHTHTNLYDSGRAVGKNDNPHLNPGIVPMPYQSVHNMSGGAMYDPTIGYRQNAFNQQGYAPATPGYQYVRDVYGRGDVGATFQSQNFAPMSQSGVPPQPVRGNSLEMDQANGQSFHVRDGRGPKRGRGRPMRAGYRPRRGNYRSR